MSIMKRAGMFVAVAAMGLGLMVDARGASLDSPAAPTDPASAMYTAQDIYDRLVTGTNAAKRTGAFTEPAAGPAAGTMPTTDEIMAKAPAVDAASGAAPADVLFGKTFWGLTQGSWGTRTGTMATRTLSSANDTVEAGYYAATTLSAVDADLTAGNIKKDVEIFGVTGSYEGGAGGAGVPKTGQTTSYRTGDDGWHGTNVGVAWPDPRFTVTTNGTDEVVTDNMTGLMWVKAPHALTDNAGTKTWEAAIDFCNALDFAGHSEWRLPNRRELFSLISDGQYNPGLPSGHPFAGVQSDSYWSSSTYAGDTGYAWLVSLVNGYVNVDSKSYTYYVWPVRAGQ